MLTELEEEVLLVDDEPPAVLVTEFPVIET
jgi:hypothetical protein